MPIEDDVLEQIKMFANSVTSSSFMGEKANQIGEVIDRKVGVLSHCFPTALITILKITETEEYPLPSASESVTHSGVLVNNSEQIAAALTALEGGMYSRIRPADYINHLQERQCPNRVADASMTTLKITFWVKQRLLHSNDIKPRGNMFKLSLKIAQVKFCNYLKGEWLINVLFGTRNAYKCATIHRQLPSLLLWNPRLSNAFLRHLESSRPRTKNCYRN
jgi:hypothetical protein